MQALNFCKETQKNFYPTPANVAEKLLENIDWYKVNSVLEPSAGKGDLIQAILKAATVCKYHNGLTVEAVELDSNLRAILNERFEKCKCNKVHVVHDDFLTFQTYNSYDLIVMNPPFEIGDKHLLHALELMERTGGEIRCILNANTIRNPYSNYRKSLLKKLDELDAEIEFVENAFSTAERSTDVEIAMIRVRIPQPKRTSRIFERLQRSAEEKNKNNVWENVTELSVTDFLNDIIQRFNVEVEAGLTLIREYKAMTPYILSDIENPNSLPILSLNIEGISSFGELDEVEYLKLTRLKYWKALLSNKKISSSLTTSLMDEYRSLVNELSCYDFSLFNVQRILNEMNAKMASSVEETILSLFDEMSHKHSWYPNTSNNIHYFDGWKTNTAHKVNQKVILPFHTMSTWNDSFNVFSIVEKISDIEKTFNYLNGCMTAPVDIYDVLNQACESGKTRNIQCKYFTLSIFKKGTVHIKFTNLELLRRFNIYCSQKKGWLPPDYGKKRYSNMDSVEKHVIDSFHGNGDTESGVQEYNEVLNDRKYYLGNRTSQHSQVSLLEMYSTPC